MTNRWTNSHPLWRSCSDSRQGALAAAIATRPAPYARSWPRIMATATTSPEALVTWSGGRRSCFLDRRRYGTGPYAVQPSPPRGPCLTAQATRVHPVRDRGDRCGLRPERRQREALRERRSIRSQRRPVSWIATELQPCVTQLRRRGRPGRLGSRRQRWIERRAAFAGGDSRRSQSILSTSTSRSRDAINPFPVRSSFNRVTDLRQVVPNHAPEGRCDRHRGGGST